MRPFKTQTDGNEPLLIQKEKLNFVEMDKYFFVFPYKIAARFSLGDHTSTDQGLFNDKTWQKVMTS